LIFDFLCLLALLFFIDRLKKARMNCAAKNKQTAAGAIVLFLLGIYMLVDAFL